MNKLSTIIIILTFNKDNMLKQYGFMCFKRMRSATYSSPFSTPSPPFATYFGFLKIARLGATFSVSVFFLSGSYGVSVAFSDIVLHCGPREVNRFAYPGVFSLQRCELGSSRLLEWAALTRVMKTTMRFAWLVNIFIWNLWFSSSRLCLSSN